MNIRSSRDIGIAIAQARKSKGLTQSQLAIEIGVTQAWISKVEQGSDKIWLGKVLMLSSHLGLSLETGNTVSNSTGREDDKLREYPALASHLSTFQKKVRPISQSDNQ
tara:strand:+ start:129 stop:452 length:324 start_codon:yes stop_codon:yes gene_type:complete